MVARAVASGHITFGLVSVPVKLYTAASSESVSFKLIGPSGVPCKQQYIDPATGDVVPRSEMTKGYEYVKGEYVSFTPDELKKLEAQSDGSLTVNEFVPLSSVDLIQIQKSYYLKPDKGGDRGYKLLSMSMESNGVVAIGTWAARGKEHFIMLRPYKGGILMHLLFFKNEVRDFDDNCASLPLSDMEMNMADQLIAQMKSTTFDVDKYRDSYTERVMDAIKSKANGKEITSAEVAAAAIPDLFAALKASLKVDK